MMTWRRSLRSQRVEGAAFGGVVLGHWLTYVLALPSGHLRHEVLASSGHGYWPLGVKLGVAFTVISLASIVARQARAALGRDLSDVDGPGRVALRLAGLQVLGFVSLEVAERVAAGAPASTMFEHHLFLLGLLVQVAVAAALAVVLFLFSRAAATVAQALASPRYPRAARRSFLAPLLWVPAPVVLAGAAAPRGPPTP
jgi:hypothetical protein